MTKFIKAFRAVVLVAAVLAVESCLFNRYMTTKDI